LLRYNSTPDLLDDFSCWRSANNASPQVTSPTDSGLRSLRDVIVMTTKPDGRTTSALGGVTTARTVGSTGNLLYDVPAKSLRPPPPGRGLSTFSSSSNDSATQYNYQSPARLSAVGSSNQVLQSTPAPAPTRLKKRYGSTDNLLDSRSSQHAPAVTLTPARDSAVRQAPPPPPGMKRFGSEDNLLADTSTGILRNVTNPVSNNERSNF